MKQKVVKRFRFGLRTLLCLPVLVGCIWWWTTWPERTSQRFVEFLNDGDVEAAQAMLIAGTPIPVAPDNNQRQSFDIWGLARHRETTFAGSDLRQRTFADLVGAKGSFSLSKENNSANQHLNFGGFDAVRGRIIRHTQADDSMRFISYRIQTNAEEVLNLLRTKSPNEAMQIIEADGKLIVRTTEQGQDELGTLLKSIDQPSDQ